MQAYCDLGLQLRVANNVVEAGLLAVWQRLTTGRLKVFRTLQGWLGEYRLYRRDEKGRVVKERDHCLDATRYLVMSGVDLARCSPDYLLRSGWKAPSLVHDFDPFAG
jgi:hypothetical protein